MDTRRARRDRAEAAFDELCTLVHERRVDEETAHGRYLAYQAPANRDAWQRAELRLERLYTIGDVILRERKRLAPPRLWWTLVRAWEWTRIVPALEWAKERLKWARERLTRRRAEAILAAAIADAQAITAAKE